MRINIIIDEVRSKYQILLYSSDFFFENLSFYTLKELIRNLKSLSETSNMYALISIHIKLLNIKSYEPLFQ